MSRTLSCPAVECIHNRDGGRCAAKRTVLQKRGALFNCKTYEQSEDFKDKLDLFDVVSKNVRGSDQKERMTK